MGADAEDVDGDGRPELFVTNFANEYNTLYRNLGRGYFLDTTANFGLVVDSIPWIGWGCARTDFAAGRLDETEADFARLERIRPLTVYERLLRFQVAGNLGKI